MEKQEIIEIQNKILDLIPNRSGIYLKYCCSEMSRLVIKWLSEYGMSYQFYILKGTNVLSTKQSHDILVVKKYDEISVLDPTIWQFFPNAKTILVYKGNNLNEGIHSAQDKYKCTWSLGQRESIPDDLTQNEYLKIVSNIISENWA